MQLFVYFYENFCLKKLTSDMVQIFQPDYVENMCFAFVFNKFIQHMEIYGLCQTRLIFLICFMSLSWHHGSQRNLSLKYFQNEETRTRNFENLYLNMFLTKLLMEIFKFMIIRSISCYSNVLMISLDC